MVAGLLLTIFGIAAAYQLARRIARRAIWRLRNRLIVAYLFIAVVPIVLILALVIFCGERHHRPDGGLPGGYGAVAPGNNTSSAKSPGW